MGAVFKVVEAMPTDVDGLSLFVTIAVAILASFVLSDFMAAFQAALTFDPRSAVS